MSLGHVWIRADDGNVYDVSEVLRLDWLGNKVTILFEEFKDNEIHWFTPDRKNNMVEELSKHLTTLGFQAKIDKPFRRGLHKGGRMEWYTTTRITKIPVAVVKANNGVPKGTMKELRKGHYEFTIAAGV